MQTAIFHHTPQQKAVAEAVVNNISRAKLYGAPIVTEMQPASAFHVAEG